MEGYYTVSEYAHIMKKDPGNIRKKLITGEIKGEKAGRQWLIPKGTAYPEDKRVKTGEYRKWRNKTAIRQSNPVLMKAIGKMCRDLGKVYGEALDQIILYGSYARGDETSESDIDIALILSEKENEAEQDARMDIVVDYELEQGVTLSVITIEKDEMALWSDTLPFYKNLLAEGVVLWKTA